MRVRVAPSPAGVALGEDRNSPWAGPLTANTCAVFKPSGFSTATCNSHGVVHFKWNPVAGADRYDLNYTKPGAKKRRPMAFPMELPPFPIPANRSKRTT